MANYANVRLLEKGSEWGDVISIIDMGDHDPESPVYVLVDGVSPAPQAGWFYNRRTSTFTDTLPIERPRRTVQASEFWMQKFTATERAKVWALCNGESVPGVTVSLEDRYRLAAFRDVTLAGEPIPLHNSEVVTIIDALESIGLLTAGRADEILER